MGAGWEKGRDGGKVGRRKAGDRWRERAGRGEEGDNVETKLKAMC